MNGKYKKLAVCLLSLVVVLSLSSCGWFKDSDSIYTGRRTCRGDCDTHKRHHQRDCLQQLCDVAREAIEVEDEKFGFAPAGGMQFKPLFTGRVADEDERFERLEDAVQQLRNEVDVIAPKVVKESEVEPQETLAYPHHLGPMSLSGKTMSKPLMVEEEKFDPYQSKMPSTVTVKSIRMADHKDKTRVVLDLTASKRIKTTIANKGMTLIIDLDGIDWATKSKWLATKGALISGYRVEGNKLYVDLMYSSKIKLRSILKPAQGVTSFYRLVVDLVSSDVHKK